MCYTANDSITTYIINLLSSTLLFYSTESTDMKIIAIFFAFVGQMQLFDYMFWTNTLCNEQNKIATKLAIIFNHMQPIVLYLLIWFYNYNQSKISNIIIILYTVFVIQYTIKIWPDKNCKQIPNTQSVCCSLPINPDDKETVIDWEWNGKTNSHIIYALFLASLTASSFDLQNNKILFATINIATYFISTKIPKLNQSVGRLWCYIAAFVPWTFYVQANLFA